MGRNGHRRLRVLLAKIGLDGHDRGIKVVARLLRQSGHEVIYLGRRQDPDAVIRTALDEDADVLGVSILSGTHHRIIDTLLETAKAHDVAIPIVVGGTILRSEIPVLVDKGVSAVFPVGTPLATIERHFEELAAAARE